MIFKFPIQRTIALLVTGVFCACLAATAQELPPKREFRAVWVATVANIDWPSEAGLSSETQKREFRQLLEKHHQTGMNDVIVQVRPAADAFYANGREPRSEWLTGTHGRTEERRVGKECVSTGRSRGWRD